MKLDRGLKYHKLPPFLKGKREQFSCFAQAIAV